MEPDNMGIWILMFEYVFLCLDMIHVMLHEYRMTCQDQEFKQEFKAFSQCRWVKDEFQQADFGDKRLYLRLLVVARHFAQHPESSINQSSGVWSKTKAAYRFFDNKKVTHEMVLKAHQRRVLDRIAQRSEPVLIVQDTTFLNYSHMQCDQSLGPIGELKASSMGLIMHNSLALTETGLALGLISQKIWCRDPAEHGKGKQRFVLPIEDKESYKWIEAMQQYNKLLPQNSNTITVCDSEADIYELFTRMQKIERRFLVRSSYNRRIQHESSESKSLYKYIDNLPVAKSMSLTVPRQSGQKQREATVEIRFAPVRIVFPKNTVLKDPSQKQKSTQLYVVSVREINAPADVEFPLSWTLLTNVSIKSVRLAQQMVCWYKTRWQVEIFHRILKSGCHVEKAQLKNNERRLPFLALHSVIAWSILMLVQFSRVSPKANAREILSKTECDVLYSVTHGKIKTGNHFNAKKATSWLAQLGGYLARKADPKPGPTHIWRGWRRLQDFALMYSLQKS